VDSPPPKAKLLKWAIWPVLIVLGIFVFGTSSPGRVSRSDEILALCAFGIVGIVLLFLGHPIPAAIFLLLVPTRWGAEIALGWLWQRLK
jgi:hypothetical protein